MTNSPIRRYETQYRQTGDSRRNLVWDFLHANLGDKGSCTPGPLHYYPVGLYASPRFLSSTKQLACKESEFNNAIVCVFAGGN